MSEPLTAPQATATVPPEGRAHALVSYPRFLWKSLILATDGSLLFYTWMIVLSAIALVGAHTWAMQVRDGLVLTNMSDHVSWGLYIANFTFGVGLAAGAVMMVIPAYIYHDRDMHDVVIVGELLAISAIIMCLLFVTVDLGRPDRFWHMMPVIGKFNFPISMLAWDVIVLNGYLLINMHICGYLLYMRFLGRTPDRRWYIPFVYLSIGWAISIHTVTAFLYCGLGGRPFWNTALLAPRFLASAFVSGPACIILALLAVQRLSTFRVPRHSIELLVNIMRVTILISLLMVVSEIFTEFYTNSSHAASARYLYFGLHGYNALVPWIWTSIVMAVIAALMLLCPKVYDHPAMLVVACILAIISFWIEKGMGLIIPAFIPSTLHEIVEYVPSIAEWKIMAGIWAFGLMCFTVSLKIAIPIFTGRVSIHHDDHFSHDNPPLLRAEGDAHTSASGSTH